MARNRCLNPQYLHLQQTRSSTLFQILGTAFNSPISRAHLQTHHMDLCFCTIPQHRNPNSWIHRSNSHVSPIHMMEKLSSHARNLEKHCTIISMTPAKHRFVVLHQPTSPKQTTIPGGVPPYITIVPNC